MVEAARSSPGIEVTSQLRSRKVHTVNVEEHFPGELETLRADNLRLRRLLKLSEEQARAADPDQATLTGAPESPVNMRSTPEDKVRFYFDLFRCRSDVYALRWENRRDGRCPITFKNRLVQYIGRVTRPYPSESTATVHDYHDELTPVIASSLRKRAPGCTKMGFPDPRKLSR